MAYNHDNLRAEIVNAKSLITDHDLFCGPLFLDYINTIVMGITKMYKESLDISIIDESNDVIAFAQGQKKLCLNLNNRYCKNQTRKIKYKIMKALTLHETGHLLFTDFKILNSNKDCMINSGKMFPEPECDEYLDLQVMLQNESKEALFHIWKDIENCIEDGFIELLLMNQVPGYGKDLLYLRHLQYKNMLTYKQQKQNNLNKYQIFHNLLLCYSKYHVFKADTEDFKSEEFQNVLPYTSFIDEIRTTPNAYLRVKKMNTLFCKVIKALYDEKQKENQNSAESNNDQKRNPSQNKNDDSKSSTESSTEKNTSKDTSKKEFSSLIESLSKNSSVSQSEGTSTENNENNSAVIQFSRNENILPNNIEKSLSSNSYDNEELTESEDKLLKDLLEQQSISIINEKVEERLRIILNKEIKETEYSNIHKGIICNFSRETKVTRPSNSKELEAELDNVVRQLTTLLLKEIHDRQRGGNLNGLYNGRRLSQMHRVDRKCFSKKIHPEEIPNMAIALLIDKSTSMRGNKIETAKKVAYVLYKFCHKLNIPICIYGHSTSGKDVQLTSYAEFNSKDGNDLYRICNLRESGSNRDGYALKYCTEHLLKQKADEHLMMIISDGAPNAQAYHKQEAIFDIQNNILKKYAKRVSFITAGIDDQKDIRDIYVNGLSPIVAAEYLNVQNLELLPETFVKIVKERLKN